MRLKNRDRTLFTEREWKLLQSSAPPHLTTFRASALKMRIRRIRTLAEKYTGYRHDDGSVRGGMSGRS
jgi:hypothetical protein